MGLLVVMVNLRGGEWSERFVLAFFRVPLKGRRRLLSGLAGVVFCLGFLFALTFSTLAKDQVHSKNGERASVQALLTAQFDPARAAAWRNKALEEFGKAISLNPLNYVYHFQRDWIAASFRGLQSSPGGPTETPPSHEEYFRTALRLYPSNARLHYGVSMFYLLNWSALTPAERLFGVSEFEKAVTLLPELRGSAREILRRAKPSNLESEVARLLEEPGKRK